MVTILSAIVCLTQNGCHRLINHWDVKENVLGSVLEMDIVIAKTIENIVRSMVVIVVKLLYCSWEKDVRVRSLKTTKLKIYFNLSP